MDFQVGQLEKQLVEKNNKTFSVVAEENPKGSKKDILKSLITCQASDVKEALHGRRPKEFFCFVLIAASNLPLTFALFEVRVQEEKFLQCIDTSLLRFNFLYLYVLRFLGELICQIQGKHYKSFCLDREGSRHSEIDL